MLNRESYLRETEYEYMGPSVNEGSSTFPISYFTKDEMIETVFKDQISSPVLIAEKGLKSYFTFKLEDVRIKAVYPLKDQKEISLKNVVAMVPGTDSMLCQEYITVGAHYVIGPSQFENALVPFIRRVNANNINWPLVFDFHSPFVGRSDHASYSKQGIPSFFFYSGPHEDLHGPGDDPEKIEYDKVEAIARLAYLITMELANMDAVPSFTE